MYKYMQSLDGHVYSELKRLARERGISLQELVRAVIIPDWMRENKKIHKGKDEQA